MELQKVKETRQRETQKKTNLIRKEGGEEGQEEYPTSVLLTIQCVEQMQNTPFASLLHLLSVFNRLVFFRVFIPTLFPNFFQFNSYMHGFFTEKLFTIVSFIFLCASRSFCLLLFPEADDEAYCTVVSLSIVPL